MAVVFLKATGIWLLIVFVAILNGLFREKVLAPQVGEKAALPLSGISLSVLVFLVTMLTVPLIGSSEAGTYIRVGVLWVALTLCFEFFFGHFVAGKTWGQIVQVFDIRKGDLFILVLLTSAFSPWLAAKLRGMF